MPPHGHGGGHHHGGGGGGWGGPWWGGYPFPVDTGPTVVIDNASSGCVVTDVEGRTRIVPCDLGDDGTDEDTPPAEDMDTPIPVMRSAISIAAGRHQPASTPYYRFAGQARSYPFDWSGRPGGVPQGHRAGETNELSGADLYESGPYYKPWPALQGRGFRMPGGQNESLSGLFDLSTNEKNLLMLAGAAAAGLFLYRRMKRRRR